MGLGITSVSEFPALGNQVGFTVQWAGSKPGSFFPLNQSVEEEAHGLNNKLHHDSVNVATVLEQLNYPSWASQEPRKVPNEWKKIGKKRGRKTTTTTRDFANKCLSWCFSVYYELQWSTVHTSCIANGWEEAFWDSSKSLRSPIKIKWELRHRLGSPRLPSTWGTLPNAALPFPGNAPVSSPYTLQSLLSVTHLLLCSPFPFPLSLYNSETGGGGEWVG